MPKIRNLSNACEVSFSPDGPISEEALERVRALLGELNAWTVFFSNWQYVTNTIRCTISLGVRLNHRAVFSCLFPNYIL
jgi:hypothetical protein